MSAELLLIDGYAVVYRSFFAIKEMSTSKGFPTNAVYGFIRTLNHLKEALKPTHWAVVFDAGLADDRMVLVPEYKAQRDPMPDDLATQLAVIDEYIEAANILSIEVDGQEADDVIASIIAALGDHCERVCIASGDKDLFQLIDEKVCLVGLSKGHELTGPAEVLEKTGVHPGQTVEWLAMMGDSADNISGIPGIGAKTAARLLQELGSIEGIFENIETVTPARIRLALVEHKEIVTRNVDMIRLRTDLEMCRNMKDFSVQKPDWGELLALFRELEFESMAKEAEEQAKGDFF